MLFPAVWEPYKAMTNSNCEDCKDFFKCGCGIYSYKRLRSLKDEYGLGFDQTSFTSTINDRNIVVGFVEIWGKTLVATKGYRSQCAYPKKFIVSDKMSQNYKNEVAYLAGIYGIVVEELDVRVLRHAINL